MRTALLLAHLTNTLDNGVVLSTKNNNAGEDFREGDRGGGCVFKQ